MNEVQSLINTLNEITESTKQINNKKGSISAKERERLKQGTEKLKEIAEKLEKLALKLGNERLQIIAEEVEEIQKEREILDNKKSISSKDNLVDDKISGKAGYSDRKQLDAMNELLKELSKDIKEVKDTFQGKINKKTSLEERIKDFEKKETFQKEIEAIMTKASPQLKLAIMKELKNNNLFQTDINLDKVPSIHDLQMQEKEKFKALNDEKQLIERILEAHALTGEEQEKIKKEKEEIDKKLLSHIKNRNEYKGIIAKITELSDQSKKYTKFETKESLTKDLEDYIQKVEQEYEETSKKIAKRMKEKQDKKKIEKLLSEKEAIIRKNMIYIPIELRAKLCEKLEEEKILNITMYNNFLDESEYTINKEIASITDIKEIEEIIKKIDENIEKDRKEVEEYATRQKDLTIKEATEGLNPEQKEYKIKVEKYLKTLLSNIGINLAKKEEYTKTIKAYNEASKTVDELIKEVKEIREGKLKTPEPAPKTPEPAPKAPEPVPKTPEPVPKTPEPVPKTPEPAPKTPETSKVEGSRKPKNKERQKKLIKVGIGVLAAALVILGIKGIVKKNKKMPTDQNIATVEINDAENNQPETPQIEILSDDVPLTETNVQQETTENETEKINTESGRQETSVEDFENNKRNYEVHEPTRNTLESQKIIHQALIDSGITETAGDDPFRVLDGTSQGIPIEKLKWYGDDGAIYFEPSGVEGIDHLVEINPTTNKKTVMTHVPKNKEQGFIESIARQKDNNVDFSSLYEQYGVNPTSTNNEVKVTPQKEVLRQTILDSGLSQHVASNEYKVMNNEFEEIKPENLQYWYDQGNMLKFKRDEKTGAYKIIEQQKDGSESVMDWTDRQTVENYIAQMSINTDEGFLNLFKKQTGEDFYETSNIYTKGVSR